MFACAGMRLHVGVLCGKNRLGAIAGEVFGHVDELASPVVTMARIALGVFVRQHAANGLHHRRAGVILRGDHFQAVTLSADLAGNGRPQLRILAFKVIHHGGALLVFVGILLRPYSPRPPPPDASGRG